MARSNAIPLAAAHALAAALAPVGDPVALGDGTSVTLWLDYTRHASSTTGAPVVALEVSRDPATTAPGDVGHWSRVPVLKSSSYAAGRMDAEPFAARFQPSAAGPTTYNLPDVSVRGATWCRLLAADDDGTNRGTVDAALSVSL